MYSCRLCGSTAVSTRERRHTYQYGQCRSCSLAFVLNPPSEAATLEQYNQGASSKLAYYRLAAASDARSFDVLLRIIERHKQAGSILDVGCNIGSFVRVAQARGWRATGVDVNVEAVEFGRQNDHLDLLTLAEMEARNDEGFDVIHSSDTLEHFSDPVATMQYYATKLKPDGLLVVSTPNYDSALCKLFQLKPTEHLYLFNQNSLTYLLRLIGLRVVATYPFDRYRNIAAMFESTTFDNLPQMKSLFKKLHGLMHEVPVRLPGGENILALARYDA